MKDIIDNIINSHIKISSIHGYGLFATEDISRNTILGYLDGQVVNWSLYNKYFLYPEWNALEDNKLLVRPYKTKYSYINHSRTPNTLLKYNPLSIIAKLDIKKDQEFTLDYRREPLPKKYLSEEGKYYL